MNANRASGGPALMWCPFPDAQTAASAGDALLGEGLVACVNIVPGIETRFVWRGQHTITQEVGVLLKTDAALLAAAIARLAELHPYEEPAILGWCCDAAAPATAAWLGALVR